MQIWRIKKLCLQISTFLINFFFFFFFKLYEKTSPWQLCPMVVEISATTPCFFCSSETPVAQGALGTWVWACACRSSAIATNYTDLHIVVIVAYYLWRTFWHKISKHFTNASDSVPISPWEKHPEKHPDEAGNSTRYFLHSASRFNASFKEKKIPGMYCGILENVSALSGFCETMLFTKLVIPVREFPPPSHCLSCWKQSSE